MRKNGFTLIELLAVIVILAIIALIATPIILGIINDARKESQERSIELYASAAKNAIAKYQLNNTSAPTSFDQLDIEYDGDVVCTTQELYEDGSIYLADCTVNGDAVEYIYGEQKGTSVAKVCTRQNDEEDFDTVTCTIGENTESFYVMNSYLTDVPSDKIVMMTKYNIDPTTYRQSADAGTVAFSSTQYWKSTVSSYPAYVYNESSNLYQYVNAYETYIKDNGVGSASATLIDGEQLVYDLGCSVAREDCSGAPEWVYSTSYWVGSTYVAYQVWYVDSFGNFVGDDYDNVDNFGVRPVITISTSDIQ